MRSLLKTAVILLLVVAAGGGLYVAADPEKLEIDQSVRATAPGQFVRLTDGYTHYEISGPPAGRVVVLVAGISVPYYIWDPTFTALTQAGFRVLRYDFYGRGFSDRPRLAYTQDDYVRQLRELLDALEIAQPIDLAGLSFGGSVVTTFADKYPSRVRSLIYVDPAFRTPYTVGALDHWPRVWNFLIAIFEERWWADRQMDDFAHPERFPDWPERYKAQLRYRGFRYAQWATSMNNTDVDQGPELKRVGSDPRPVMAFWGKEDQAVPIEFASILVEAMPRLKLITVESAGHLPQWERPDVVHPALIEFLR